MSKKKFMVVVDTREQKPYKFERSMLKTLESGDYSIRGLEDRIVIERKSKTDAFGSLGKGRSRFEREVKRMSEYEYAAIVIESSLASFLRPPAFTRMNPKAALNTLISWSVKYGVFIYFASDRKHARALVYRILEKFWKHRKQHGTESE